MVTGFFGDRLLSDFYGFCRIPFYPFACDRKAIEPFLIIKSA